jgi:hypothetical protein
VAALRARRTRRRQRRDRRDRLAARLVVTWQHQLRDDLRAEGHSRATFELEEVEGATKLTVTHEIGVSPSKLIAGVAGGWPPILASLKSLLETGEALEVARHWPKGY